MSTDLIFDGLKPSLRRGRVLRLYTRILTPAALISAMKSAWSTSTPLSRRKIRLLRESLFDEKREAMSGSETAAEKGPNHAIDKTEYHLTVRAAAVELPAPCFQAIQTQPSRPR